MMDDDEAIDKRYELQNELTQYSLYEEYFKLLNRYDGSDENSVPFPKFVNVLNHILNTDLDSYDVLNVVTERIGQLCKQLNLKYSKQDN